MRTGADVERLGQECGLAVNITNMCEDAIILAMWRTAPCGGFEMRHHVAFRHEDESLGGRSASVVAKNVVGDFGMAIACPRGKDVRVEYPRCQYKSVEVDVHYSRNGSGHILVIATL